MRITQFAKKYKCDIYMIDYWTRIGLLHPKVHDNGYRDYGSQAEDEIRRIILAIMSGGIGSIEKRVNSLDDMSSAEWNRLEEQLIFERDKNIEWFNFAFDALEEFRV